MSKKETRTLFRLYKYNNDLKNGNNYLWLVKLINDLLFLDKENAENQMEKEYSNYISHIKRSEDLVKIEKQYDNFKYKIEGYDYNHTDGKIFTYSQYELYFAFKCVFFHNKAWDSVFNPYIYSIENCSRPLDGSPVNKIRFWNNSYGMLGESASERTVNIIVQDIRDTIDEYVKRLQNMNSLINDFLIPIDSMLYEIRKEDTNRDHISKQSYEIATYIYKDDSVFGDAKRFNDKYKIDSEILNAKVFTESLIICLLFGTIEAGQNRDYIKKYVNKRIKKAETINFLIKSADAILFDLRNFQNNSDSLSVNIRGKFLLTSPGGTGKSYALEYISMLLKDSIYVNLNSNDILELYSDDKDGNGERENHLEKFSEKIIFFDSLNEVMMSDRNAYIYICEDINRLEDKNIIVASRFNKATHSILSDRFKACSLAVDVDAGKADRYADRLKLKSNLRNIMTYPLFFKMGELLFDLDVSGKKNNSKGAVKTKFAFFCKYLNSICKPFFEKPEYIFMNLYILPRMASEYKNKGESIDVLKDRVQKYISESTKNKTVYNDSEKCYQLDNYVILYINTALKLIGKEDIKCPGSIDVTRVMGLSPIRRSLLNVDQANDKYSFSHEIIYDFLAAFDYIVRFELSVKYALRGTLKEYRYVFENESTLIINNDFTDIDSFIIEYFENEQSEKFESFFDRITGRIKEKIKEDLDDFDAKRMYGVMSVLETSVEIAVVLKHLEKLPELTSEVVQNYCSLGLELLKNTDYLDEHPRCLEDSRFLVVMENFFERDLEYFRRFRTDEYSKHIKQYSCVYKPLKRCSVVIRNQEYKYEQVVLQKRYKDILKEIPMAELYKYSFSKIEANKFIKIKTDILDLKKDINGLITDLNGNVCEMSYNLLGLMLGYPNLSLISLGYERDVKNAFITVDKMIRNSERKGTFLQYTYTLAYRLLLFDVKIKDIYVNNDKKAIKADMLEIRDGCLSKDEVGTIKYLERLRRLSGGLDFDSLLSMQLVEDYLLGKANSKETCRFERLDENENSRNYLPYMTLKYCVKKSRDGSDKFELVYESKLLKSISELISTSYGPEKLTKNVVFESTNCMYNIIFSLKLLRSLRAHNSKKGCKDVETIERELVETFFQLVDADGDLKKELINEVVSFFQE